MIIGMSSGCRPWLNVSCAPHSPCLVSILIPVCPDHQEEDDMSDTRARDTICV